MSEQAGALVRIEDPMRNVSTTAVDPMGMEVRFGLSAETRDVGVTIDDMGNLMWPPTLDQVGPQVLQVQVTNGYFTVTQNIPVVVRRFHNDPGQARCEWEPGAGRGQRAGDRHDSGGAQRRVHGELRG